MLAERPPLFFLAFLGLFLLVLTVVTVVAHGAGAVRSPAFLLLAGFGAVLGLGEAFSAFVLARAGRGSRAGAPAPGREQALRIATLGMLVLAPVTAAALGWLWPVFDDVLR